VADEDDRASCWSRTRWSRHILVEPGQRLLHDADAIAVAAQHVINATPARTIDECAVNEDDGHGRRGDGADCAFVPAAIINAAIAPRNCESSSCSLHSRRRWSAVGIYR